LSPSTTAIECATGRRADAMNRSGAARVAADQAIWSIWATPRTAWSATAPTRTRPSTAPGGHMRSAGRGLTDGHNKGSGAHPPTGRCRRSGRPLRRLRSTSPRSRHSPPTYNC
jgi:hypothetical protein